MPLYVVATPIGNAGDFTRRSLEVMASADLIVGEELKALRRILKSAGIQARATDQLNEHSRPADIAHLVNECKERNVALVSDCGTPGFCDPGAELVAACHAAGVRVHAVAGASSLMALLSVCGARLEQFVFAGFLPAKSEARRAALLALRKERRPLVLMETPYRCARLVEDLGEHFAHRDCVLGLNLTQEDERLVRATGRQLGRHGPFTDAEPIVLILP